MLTPTGAELLLVSCPVLCCTRHVSCVCAGPKGSSRVEVSFFLDANNVLTATATDLDNARQEQWLRQGGMMAVAHSADVRTL